MTPVAVEKAQAHASLDSIREPESQDLGVESLGPFQVRHEKHRGPQPTAAGNETGKSSARPERRRPRRESPAQFVAEAKRVDEPRQVRNGALAGQCSIAGVHFESFLLKRRDRGLECWRSGDCPSEGSKVIGLAGVN